MLLNVQRRSSDVRACVAQRHSDVKFSFAGSSDPAKYFAECVLACDVRCANRQDSPASSADRVKEAMCGRGLAGRSDAI